MILKKIFITFSIVSPLVLGGVAAAATIPSDFAQDVKDGTSQLNNDPAAKAQADN
ncbi:MAG: hypothetical protein NVS1B10_07690 [Candidatus Saccharimonadales bacterium]